MSTHVDQNDLKLAQLQFQSDAILQGDGDRMQPLQTPLQRMQSQRRVEWILLQQSQCLVVTVEQVGMALVCD